MKSPLLMRRVVGHSMWPTLAPDDVVLASSWLPLKTGAVVIANVDGRDCIKRVTAVRGRSVELTGDNYYHSQDSRHYGRIDKSAIRGVVIGLPRSLGAVSLPGNHPQNA